MSTEEAREEERLSALRENIARKGANAYYYAHGKKIDGPQWDGKEEPRLLSVTTEPTTISTTTRLAQPINTYSWCDEKRTVKVYIDFELAASVDDAQVTIQTTANSLDFRLSDVAGKDYKLSLSPLNNEIVTGTYKKKEGSFVLSLKKADEVSWHSLLKK